MTSPLDYRSPILVAGILGAVYDSEEPYPWRELVQTMATAAHGTKTVENTIYDLIAFGALHRIGKPADRCRADTRALKPTALGRAWLDRELLDLHAGPDETELEQ